MAANNRDTLETALARKVALKVCASVGGRDCVFETRLMKPAARADQAFWAQFVRGDGQALEFLINNRLPAEAWLSMDGAKLMFGTQVLKRDRQYWLTSSMMIDALMLKWPEEVLVSQQRKSGRMLVTERLGVQAELFRTKGWTGTAGVYKDACKIPAELWDLSADGASFVCPFDKSLLAIGAEEPLLVSVVYYKSKVVLEGRRVHTRTLSGAMRIGVRFVSGAGEVPGSLETYRRIVEELEGRVNHRLFAAARAGMVA